MRESHLAANSVTYGCLLDACVKSGSLDMAEKVFDCMIGDGVALNTVIYTTMIKGYSKASKLAEANNIYR